jgi:hypothetical protein
VADPHLLVRALLGAGRRRAVRHDRGDPGQPDDLIGISLWILYRIVRGWLALLERKPMDIPQ